MSEFPERDYPYRRETDSLHEELQAHINRCDQCRKEIEKPHRPRFGDTSGMCQEYFKIVRYWQGETS